MPQVVPREEECPSCRRDLKVCLNCENYDQAAYNQCKEPNAERVVEKDRRNFCDYFKIRQTNSSSQKSQSKEEILKDLDNLFKK